MKTILISTDFSNNVTNAAEYGYNLAKQIGGKVILSSVFALADEMLEANVLGAPGCEYNTIMESRDENLNTLKEHLKKNDKGEFHPPIKCVKALGTLQDVIAGVADKEKIDLVVIRADNNSEFSGFVLGNHSQKMIDNATAPLLLVPAWAKPRLVKKIAFASDFEDTTADLNFIYSLITFAKPLNAEILITYVHNKKDGTDKAGNQLEVMLADLSKKADYPNICYRLVEGQNLEVGLAWLCEQEHVDMLAMVHRHHSLLDYIMDGSYTQKVARHIVVPLLIFLG